MKRNKKGFTLIELLAVIVVLAIIALIATPIVLNLVEKARKGAFMRSAEGVLKTSKLEYASNLVTNPSVQKDFFECSGNICLSNRLDNNNKRIPLNVDGKVGDGTITIYENGDIEFVISDGRYCAVKYREEEKINIENGDCSTVDLRKNGKVVLSSGGASYIYPDAGTFEVKENLSNGILTCSSNDEDVATCSIEGTTVIVTPGVKEGIADITITSSGTAEYKEASAVHAVITSKGTLNTISANGYTGVYDGKEHGITVTSDNSIIKYGINPDACDLDESPTYVDAGTYTVYYEVNKDGYKTATGSKDVIITKVDNVLTLSSDNGTYKYPVTGTFTVTNPSASDLSCSSNNESIATCSIEGTTVTIIPGIVSGNVTITITSAEATNYNAGTITHDATILNGTLDDIIANGYTGVYDEKAHGITVTSEGATIEYSTSENGIYTPTNPTYTDVGTYTVYYQVSKAGYTTVKDYKQVVITQKANNLEISSSGATYTYPTSGTFTVTNPTGGTLSCKSSNTAVATCSISGTTVTVTPGTTAGTADITVTSAATKNYKSVSKVHAATTKSGLITVNAKGYTGEYDGKAHGITVTTSLNGATIKYSTSENGTYTSTNPTYTSYGTYTVYYQVSKAGYATSKGSQKVVINDTVKPTVSYNLAEGSYNTTKTVRVTASDVHYSHMKVHVYKDGTKIDAKSNNNITNTYYDVALDSDGVWKVYTFAYDEAGNYQNQTPSNSSGWYYQQYTIDTVKPTASYNLAAGTYYEGQQVTITAADTNFSYMDVHVYDVSTGLIVDSLTKNGVTSQSYTITFAAAGSYRVHAMPYDKANNKTEKIQSYVIENYCLTIQKECESSCSSAGQGYSSCMAGCVSGTSQNACTYSGSSNDCEWQCLGVRNAAGQACQNGGGSNCGDYADSKYEECMQGCA